MSNRSTAKLGGFLSIAGGCVSILGEALIRASMFLIEGKDVPNIGLEFFGDMNSVAAGFFSGAVSVGVIAPSFIRTIRTTRDWNVHWSKYGLLFGAFAGVLNVFVLGSVLLSSFVFAVMTTGQAQAWEAAWFFITYLTVGLIMFALPSAFIGALGGIVAEIFLRRH